MLNICSSGLLLFHKLFHGLGTQILRFTSIYLVSLYGSFRNTPSKVSGSLLQLLNRRMTVGRNGGSKSWINFGYVASIPHSIHYNLCFQGNAGSSREVSRLVAESLAMTDELLGLCDYDLQKNRKKVNDSTMSMSECCPRLYKLGHSELLIPLQESLTVTLPPTSASQSQHKPFPLDSPTFEGMYYTLIKD